MSTSNMRQDIPISTRKMIYEKSGGVCTHCGKHISYQKATIDHVIPLYRGGSNELTNMVTLCWECNQAKDTKIIQAFEYYKYLDIQELKRIENMIIEYQNSNQWAGTQTFYRADSMFIGYECGLSSASKLKRNQRTGNKFNAKSINLGATLSKVTYDQMEAVYEYVKGYYDKHKLNKDNLFDVLSIWFDRRSFYMLSRGASIIAILPIAYESVRMRDTEGGYYETYHVVVNGIMCKYQKRENLVLIEKAIDQLIHDQATLHPDKHTRILFTVAKNDTFAQLLVSELGAQKGGGEEDNDFFDYILPVYEQGNGYEVALFKTTKEELKKLTQSEYSKKAQKAEQDYSKFLERTIGLPSLEAKKEQYDAKENRDYSKLSSKKRSDFYSRGKKVKAKSTQKTQIIKEKRKKLSELDEYDYEYYQA